MKTIRSICLTALVLSALALALSLPVGNSGNPSQYYSLVLSTWMLANMGIASGVAAVLYTVGYEDSIYDLLGWVFLGLVVPGFIVVPAISAIWGHWYAIANTVAYNVALIVSIFAILATNGKEEWLMSSQEREKRRITI